MKKFFKPIIIYLLCRESIAVLKKYTPKIIAITGSVGKTSTKEAVFTALSEFEYVRKSQKSFNTEFGVPLTILGQNVPSNLTNLFAWIEVLLEGLITIVFPHHYPKWLILEVGTDRPGDIAELTTWLKPDVVIVTKLPEVPVHVEAFGSPEDLYREKGNLVRALSKDGTLILNAEDKNVLEYRDDFSGKTLLFGDAPVSDVRAEKYEIVYENEKPVGVRFDVALGGNAYPIELRGTLGRQHIQQVLAAMTVVYMLGENLSVAARSFSNETPTPGRVRIIEGVNGSTIIDDTYNSSPVAVEEGLKTLKEVRAKRKIAILGDMLELGRFSIDAHKTAGEQVAKVADVLVTVGVRSHATAEAALASKMKEKNVHQFEDSRQAARSLTELVTEGDVIFIKGSQSVRMERVVEALMRDTSKKGKLLVRQEEEWKKRS